MPCLLKLPKKNSPGIVTFNTGELFSSLFKKKKIQKFINNKNDWVFCSWRSHYQCLLKGVPPKKLKKEIE